MWEGDMSLAVIEQIKELTKTLSPQEKKELVKEIMATLPPEVMEHAPDVPKKPRILGLHAHLGKVWMSDDFHDELPDEFWLGR
jgi:hypothetical protein